MPKPDGSTWSGTCTATDEHKRPPWASPGPDEEGIELDGAGLMKLAETPKGHDAYVAGVTHAEAVTRVGLTPDWTAGTLGVDFDGVTIGICRAPGA